MHPTDHARRRRDASLANPRLMRSFPRVVSRTQTCRPYRTPASASLRSQCKLLHPHRLTSFLCTLSLIMLCRVYVPHVPVTRALAIPALRLAHTSALRHSPLVTSAPARSPAPSRSPSAAREVLLSRSFSTTPRRQANEDPNLQAMFAQQQKLLKLLQDKPEVVENIKEFVTLLQNNGAPHRICVPRWTSTDDLNGSGAFHRCRRTLWPDA